MTTKKETAAALSIFGRLGGSANTDAQNEARKRNARLAGAPRRVCDGCGGHVRKPVRGEHGGHMDAKRDTKCHVTAWHWQTPTERREAEGK